MTKEASLSEYHFLFSPPLLSLKKKKKEKEKQNLCPYAIFWHALNMGRNGHKEENKRIVLDEKVCRFHELAKINEGMTNLKLLKEKYR